MDTDMSDEELAKELENLKTAKASTAEMAAATAPTGKVTLWHKITEALNTVWHRLTASKVTWMAVPAAIAQLWLALSGDDISGQVTAVFTALWLFLSLNNPDDQQNF